MALSKVEANTIAHKLEEVVDIMNLITLLCEENLKQEGFSHEISELLEFAKKVADNVNPEMPASMARELRKVHILSPEGD